VWTPERLDDPEITCLEQPRLYEDAGTARQPDLVVEAALTAALIGTGMPSKEALATVLIFRAATFWIPVVARWGAYVLIHPKASSSSVDESLRRNNTSRVGVLGGRDLAISSADPCR
jgi:hypothetical protein